MFGCPWVGRRPHPLPRAPAARAVNKPPFAWDASTGTAARNEHFRPAFLAVGRDIRTGSTALCLARGSSRLTGSGSKRLRALFCPQPRRKNRRAGQAVRRLVSRTLPRNPPLCTRHLTSSLHCGAWSHLQRVLACSPLPPKLQGVVF